MYLLFIFHNFSLCHIHVIYISTPFYHSNIAFAITIFLIRSVETLVIFITNYIINYRLSSRSMLGENNKLLASVKYNQSKEYYDENKMTVYREIRYCPDTYLYPSISLLCSNFGKFFIRFEFIRFHYRI